MKKKIGIAAAVVGFIDLLVWIVLIFTGAVFDGFGFSGLALFVFILWFVCVAVAVFCLAGDLIRFAGKQFSAGFNSAVQGPTAFCTACGKKIGPDVTFCPYCGQKLK